MREYFIPNFKHKNTVYLKIQYTQKPWPTLIIKLRVIWRLAWGFGIPGFRQTRLKANIFPRVFPCLIPVRRLPRPSRSMYFGDVSGLKNSLGPHDPQRIDRAE